MPDNNQQKQQPNQDEGKDLFEAGWYTNGTPRVINIVGSIEGQETIHAVPGSPVKLEGDNLKNRHIAHLIKHGELVKTDSVEERTAKEKDADNQKKVNEK